MIILGFTNYAWPTSSGSATFYQDTKIVKALPNIYKFFLQSPSGRHALFLSMCENCLKKNKCTDRSKKWCSNSFSVIQYEKMFSHHCYISGKKVTQKHEQEMQEIRQVQGWRWVAAYLDPSLAWIRVMLSPCHHVYHQDRRIIVATKRATN